MPPRQVIIKVRQYKLGCELSIWEIKYHWSQLSWQRPDCNPYNGTNKPEYENVSKKRGIERS